MGFTFKKAPRATGLRSIGHPYSNVSIKLNKCRIGWIDAPSATGHSEWEIWLRLGDTNDPIGWRNARMKPRFATEADARAYLKLNFKEIIANFKLHPEED